MNVPDLVFWGFVATLVLTLLLEAGQGLGFTRLTMAFILGTIVTGDRTRARGVGFLMHLASGLAFSILYALAFERWQRATWRLGGGIGVVHGLFVSIVVLPHAVVPGVTAGSAGSSLRSATASATR